ncbi:Mitotic spindle assembly checkpoint protein MAD2A [Pseudolycoriella hygida]|uniref:Mitotic spindle assembly checkpoint protein MAD2A n=1 Tax=Pseudolycoriella hygida TaxID=35572 RepID=A0A9Q0S2R9_9DIPT|nr:Mitotic spindle assembly checkpoint protein MAD2A [Pseudolycoriella hygida]
MTSTLQATKNAITLKGSTAIVSDYLKYGINSILFQRGIYPPEDFQSTQQYGLTILVSTDQKIQKFLQSILEQIETFLNRNELEKISMIITDAHTKETLECWDFTVEVDDTSVVNQENIKNAKDLKRIQMEIGSVMRQIGATVSYLPLLDNICSFDILLQTKDTTEVPEKWDETKPVCIQNAQSVQLRSFSTGVHTVNTAVSYKYNN